MSDKKYVVFRVYSEKERPGINCESRIVFYGWTTSKVVIKAFKKQRNPDKYIVWKLNDEQIERCRIEPDMDQIIDFIQLPSNTSHTDVNIFMTKEEMKEVEKRISKFIRTSFTLVDLGETSDDHWRILEAFNNIKDKYQEALQYFGIWPDELNSLYDDIEYRESCDSLYDVDHMIDASYQEDGDIPHETYTHSPISPGYKAVSAWKLTERLFYSAEAFIMMMKDNM